MKTTAVFSAFLSLLSLASAASSKKSSSTSTTLPVTFRPPQVFRNANLVHIISVEKNYAKENINVLVENIDKAAQDEYFVPFTADQMSRLGGVEVKDRKDASAGPFVAEAVEFDQESDIQYLRIRLPKPLAPGAQQTLGISYYLLKAYKPLPASIKQEDQQYLSFSFSAYCPSAYTTNKQKTEVKFPTGNIPDYTKLPGSGEVKEFPQKQGSKLTYGPFDEKPAGAVQPVSVRFEFNKPVTHVSRLERDIEVSHWGGNVAFEERYTLHHRGANLSLLFNRVKWQQSQYYQPTTFALKELKFPLRVGSVDPYYTDVIGNVSTSRFRSNKREALLEIKPRYPVFGGWKYPFTIGWNSDAKNFLRRTAAGGFVLNVPFLEGPRQAEGVEYEQVQVRVILPEGAENVKYHTSIPTSSITEAGVEIHKTFLDTIGRTALVIKARNLVDDFRDRELVVTYDYPLVAMLRKPLIVFASVFAVLVGAWVVGNVELKFDSRKK
ncbi:Dolichyl-diphosphooligosaccharide--protein glycosyltransferase subunit 1 [Achaetomium macrosporum]|uniref:Dolichyl-diphosphooligosaccharide--protein glycosyltransferase subunit 1 n=1 Tax=Achaetomium macrosporum TaxID=79813 RepID=A0AAN7HED6_9PEZI|nr:Dolichyl-diphosphooligosaccharide--protein glycosyltransferase subunit 1 [Achaetomium macrosporum]